MFLSDTYKGSKAFLNSQLDYSTPKDHGFISNSWMNFDNFSSSILTLDNSQLFQKYIVIYREIWPQCGMLL